MELVVGVARLAWACLAIRPRRRDRRARARVARNVALGASQVVLLTASQAAVLAVGPSGMVVPEVAAAESVCTDAFAVSEGAWSTPGNWSEGRVPGSSDVACIGSGKTARVFEAGNQAGVVQGEGTLELADGSLEVSDALEVSSLHALTLTGGILTGAATVDVSGSLTWEGGVMAGSGSTVIAFGATASLGNVNIEGSRLVVNEGTATDGSNTFTMSETAVFENTGTFKANAESTPPVFRVYTGTPKIVNTGLFEKTAGTGRTEIGIPFESEGTIDGASGELRFFSGTEVALSASTLEGSIESFATVTAGNLKASHVTLLVAGGSFSVSGGSTATIGTLEQVNASAILTGAGTVDVSGSLTTNYGVMRGSGSTVVLPGATATLGNTYLEEARSLVNEGVVTFGEGEITMTGTAEIKNLATFKANAETTSPVFRIGEGGTPRIVNSGVFEKTSGTERGEVEPHFENLGSIKEETGKLDFLKPIKAEPETQYGGSENPSAPGQAPLPKCGDPVDCATGNFSEAQTDLAVGGRGVGLGWTRYYNSQAAAAANTKGMFGYGWNSSFSDHLVIEKASTEKPVAKAVLYQADGARFRSRKAGGNILLRNGRRIRLGVRAPGIR